MITHNLGYPRIGAQRELKKACEAFWAGQSDQDQLLSQAQQIRKENWLVQQQAGIDLIPTNDFSLYDQVLDMSLMLGCIPERFEGLVQSGVDQLSLYFAMARGLQSDGFDIKAMEMTKWFDTNYHYLVPEYSADQQFKLFSTKAIDETKEALALGIKAKPVLIGPVTYLLLGKEKEENFQRNSLIDRLLPVYIDLVKQLAELGVEYIQFDEPCLATDLTDGQRLALQNTYSSLRQEFPELKIILANYFDCYGDNLETALSLPVDVLHLDLMRCGNQLDDILLSGRLQQTVSLSLGLVDGRNIWANEFEKSLRFVHKAQEAIGQDRIMIAPSCSLLHSPVDLDLEQRLNPEIKQWLAFAKQKLNEVERIHQLAVNPGLNEEILAENKAIHANRSTSSLINNPAVQSRVASLSPDQSRRTSAFSNRRKLQHEKLGLPKFPTTTIGSFPQTGEVRRWRLQLKKGELNAQQYDQLISEEIKKTIDIQEQIGLDMLVHGESERNDMVEYFGERLNGFAFTQFGWVQSYGSRCVKPPIIYGDVSRPNPMTVKWSKYAQSLTDRPVKGMLTGPVTILQWSFVRNDQPRSSTCNQIALAIRDEVVDLEQAGLKAIQIDEPAIREGLPLRKSDWRAYLDWAVQAFRISASGVKDETQIHTHMCYSEFNDIIEHIAQMDADVITIECSRSHMELLDAFAEFQYPNEIGPGVYDIHSPRIPSREEMVDLINRACELVPDDQLWVNPDCGLKTRNWEETVSALKEMVAAALELRASEPVLAD